MTTPPPAHKTHPVMRFLHLALLITATFIAALAVIHFSQTPPKVDTQRQETTPRTIAIAGQALTIPNNMIRFADQRMKEFAQQIDLALLWPAMEGYTAENAEKFQKNNGQQPILFITIKEKQSEHLDTTDMLDAVYARFFDSGQLDAPNGLVGRRLSKNSGYGNEIIYYQPQVRRPFVTRCSEPQKNVITSTCLREITINDHLTVFYRFPANLMHNWYRLDADIRKLIGRLRLPNPQN